MLAHIEDNGLRVAAARVVDHGACSTEVPYETPKPVNPGASAVQPIFPFINNLLWTQIAQQLNTQTGPCPPLGQRSDPSGTQNLGEVLSWLGNPPSLTNATGGFFLVADIALETGNALAPTGRLAFQWHYGLGLDPNDPGILTVVSKSNDYTDFYANAPLDFQVGLDQTPVVKALQGVQQQVHDFAKSLQTQDIFATTQCNENGTCTTSHPYTCDPRIATGPDGQCFDAATHLLAAIELNAQPKLASALGFSQQDADDLTKTANAVRADGTFANWSCVADATACGVTPTTGHCAYVVRAKRLNILPDEVELVWFDGMEINNPAFAVWVAGVGNETVPVPGNALPALCSAPQVANTSFVREFARDLQSGGNTKDVPCLPCTTVQGVTAGGGGCATAPLGKVPPSLPTLALLALTASAARGRRRSRRGGRA